MNAAGIHERWAGDHHEDALLIAVNVEYGVERPQDVCFFLLLWTRLDDSNMINHTLPITHYALQVTHYGLSNRMKTHKDLDVWKEAMTLAKGIYRLTAEFPKEEKCCLV